MGVYCICGAPHGVIPLYFMGVTDWFRYGPERKSPVALAAKVIFNIPGLREIFLSFALPGTPENFARLAKAGRSVSIVPGGVPEMILQSPGNKVKIVTAHNGFIKLCLQHGVSLLPVFAFGENNMWEQTRPRKSIADWISRFTGGFYPFWYQGEYWCIPKRGPVVIVSATPISLPKVVQPSAQEVDFYHELFALSIFFFRFPTNRLKKIYYMCRFYKTLSDLVRKYKAELADFKDLEVEFIGKSHLNVDCKALPASSPLEGSSSKL